MSEERRVEQRHKVVITIELAFERALSLHACENLSAGGAFFRHAIPYKVGTQVQVTFSLPGERELIRCSGEVANVPHPLEFGMGVKFIGLSDDQRARITAFAERAAQRGVEP